MSLAFYDPALEEGFRRCGSVALLPQLGVTIC